MKSEAHYSNGKPTTNLKEYYKSGKPKTKYPTIQVKENDDTALYDKVVLEITLSEKRKNVKFYIAEDPDVTVKTIDLEKYNLRPILMRNRRGIVNIHVPKGHGIMKRVPIIAEYNTIGGRKKIATRVYNLAVTHI
ncbi:hypothetical protein [Flammeovirga aprica]|uniref:Uncharacterized protein n=1 Tax=Flammeovirga aprica JL-4 TaxID=694437 RepID=A0A7X9S093_9BACT|nr:hypothetical protein [Flammeovirga aprica]NME71960.1 hypothetical protein [Flammeovirga aprica JL-4]